MDELKHVLSVGDELGEGPLWNPDDHSLYWVDILKNCYHRYHPASGAHQVFEVGENIGVLAFRQKGGMVMATEHGFAFWNPEKKTLERIGDPEKDKPQTKFNDGAVDRQGRFWAGTLGDSYNNSLYRLDPDLSIHRMDTGFDCSNGIGWSLDNKVMYFTDSTPGIIYAYDFDPGTSGIENRRVFIDSSDRPGLPDGLTVDREGYIWSARWDGWCVERYDPDGKLERTVRLPVQFPTSVMFGGENLDDLYITSARIEIPLAERQQHPQAGDLFCLKAGVRGLLEPKFAG